MELEIYYKKKMGKTTKTKLSNMLLNNIWVIKELKGEFKKYLGTSKNIYDIPKSMECSRSSSYVHRDVDLPLETRKISI